MSKAEKGELQSDNDRLQFRMELFFALIITGLACCAGFSNLLLASNDIFPLTSDAMGHMAKVRYLAECFSKGEFPAWFPYWYNGATVAQYYPPFSYWVMMPIFMLTQNAMLTFKINCFLMIFIGGMGTWYFCRTYIGRWCGLIGSMFFCLQPYILLTFFGAGLLAQGPVIALTPWYLIAMLAFGKNPKAKTFWPCTVLCALMILSHPMTIFMICFCIMVVFLIFVFLKKITFQHYCYMIFTIIFAGSLTAFWSLVGVTQLETPGVPYLLVEASLNYTATLKWYTTLSSGFFYFAIPISVGCIAALLLFVYRISKKETERNEQYYVLFCILLTFFTILFSFGLHLPLFKYLPLAESYVPGRILGMTAASGAILCAYLLYSIQRWAKRKKIWYKILSFLLCISIIGGVLFYMNPFKAQYLTMTNKIFNEMILTDKTEGNNFEKGRYACVGVVESSETYFPITYNFNTTIGWNIEGTPHNQALWNQNIAIPCNDYDYLAKDFAFWNVRSFYADGKYEKGIVRSTKKLDFKYNSIRGTGVFCTSDAPSSYFLADKRNALILGVGAPAVAIEFPELVYEKENDISKCSMKELEKYETIYLCEPAVDTEQEKKSIESTVEKLVNRGVNIIIEPTVTKGYSLFNVTTCDVPSEQKPILKKQGGSFIKSNISNINVDEGMMYCRVLFGLDKVDYGLIQNNGRMKNAAIGTKKVGSGNVLFIGMHLSKYLKAVYIRNWGLQENNKWPACSDDVRALYEDLFKTCGIVTDFWPDVFPVEKAVWNYKGVDFTYSSERAREMTISVTYTPRWHATIDGKPLEVGQTENLITLDLPAGKHQVKLVYGLTKYGIAGYIISVIGLLTFLLFLRFYDIIVYRFARICACLKKALQL